jgi:hypothetical protein
MQEKPLRVTGQQHACYIHRAVGFVQIVLQRKSCKERCVPVGSMVSSSAYLRTSLIYVHIGLQSLNVSFKN